MTDRIVQIKDRWHYHRVGSLETRCGLLLTGEEPSKAGLPQCSRCLRMGSRAVTGRRHFVAAPRLGTEGEWA